MRPGGYDCGLIHLVRRPICATHRREQRAVQSDGTQFTEGSKHYNISVVTGGAKGLNDVSHFVTVRFPSLNS